MSSPPEALGPCSICGFKPLEAAAEEVGCVFGNTARFRDQTFPLWRCGCCGTIHSLAEVDFSDIYRDYPLNRRKLDLFARQTMLRLIRRLEREGLERSHAILDFGCGNGVFLRFLENRGYLRVQGYDPYFERYAALPERGPGYDCVICNDVIEHVDEVRAIVRLCRDLVRPGGLVYIGTCDAAGIDMENLERHAMALHQPFHRTLLTQPRLEALVQESGLRLLRSYRRSYLDSPFPFANYRFLDELNRALNHVIDSVIDLDDPGFILRRPRLLFFGLFGYLLPSALEPAVVLRKEAGEDGRVSLGLDSR
jgi:SAM-dependent methyltransferase